MEPTKQPILLCPMVFNQSPDKLRDLLYPGCAVLALKDMALPSYGSSAAILACGNVDIAKEDLSGERTYTSFDL